MALPHTRGSTNASGAGVGVYALATCVSLPSGYGACAVPRPSQLNNLSVASPPSTLALGDDALHMFIVKYADNGSFYSQWHAATALYMINMQCNARPSPLLFMKNMIANFAQMRAAQPAEEEDKSNLVPYTLEDLSKEMQATYTFTSKQTVDEDEVGFAIN